MNDNQEQGFTGVWTPAHVAQDKDLTISERFIYGYIASFSKACFRSNEAIAEDLNISIPTISSAVKKLVEKGYIYVQYVNNNHAKRRIYSLLDDPKKVDYINELKGVNKNHEPSEEVNKNFNEVNKNHEPHNRGEVNKNHEHRIKENNNRKSTADLAKADETPAKPAGTSWADVVEERMEERSEIKAPAGYFVVDPNEEYTAKDLYGEKRDSKTAKTIADIKKQPWYVYSKKFKEEVV